MATASRMRPPAGSKPRAAIPNLTALLVFDALRTWVIPVVAGAVIVAAAALSATGLVPVEGALATAIVAALVLLAYVGERPLLAADAPRRDQLIGLGFTVVWLAFCYVPFYTRIFLGHRFSTRSTCKQTAAAFPSGSPRPATARSTSCSRANCRPTPRAEPRRRCTIA